MFCFSSMAPRDLVFVTAEARDDGYRKVDILCFNSKHIHERCPDRNTFGRTGLPLEARKELVLLQSRITTAVRDW